MTQPKLLSLQQSLDLIAKHHIPIVPHRFIRNQTELEKALKKNLFPCVLKAVSVHAIHKTEQKALCLNLSTPQQVQNAYQKLQKIKGFQGALLQPQLEGIELFIGSKKDIQFGPTLVFGIGGTLVELLKDTTIRIPPITLSDAQHMIQDLHYQALLHGFRGKSKVNEKQLVTILVQASRMIQKLQPEELDINPLMATKKGIFAVDARIVL